jgi:hypothetical protein
MFMKITSSILLVAIVGSGAGGCAQRSDDGSGNTALDVTGTPETISSNSEQQESHKKTVSRDGEEQGVLEGQAALENPIVREILVKDLDILGEWDGDPATAIRAFVDIHINDAKEYASRGTFQVDFLVETKSQMTAVVRLANFTNGILTLDEPVEDERGIDSEFSFSALLAVSTDRGEFLIPACNAVVMKTTDELKPGFAYRRISNGR